MKLFEKTITVEPISGFGKMYNIRRTVFRFFGIPVYTKVTW